MTDQSADSRAERMAEIEAREDKATSPDWTVEHLSLYNSDAICVAHGAFMLSGDGEPGFDDDVAFITNARADIPWLLAELRAAQDFHSSEMRRVDVYLNALHERAKTSEFQLERMRAVVARAKDALCPLCKDHVPLESGGQYDGWHRLTELGGASDGGTDYEECKAAVLAELEK